MAKKLMARVRYNKGLEGVGPDEGKAGECESLILETWDDGYKEWCVDTIAPFRRCKEYPDAKEAEFIHYDLLMKIFQLQKLGYSIHLAKAGE